MFTRFDATKSTKGASKLRRDLINAEIANLRDLLPLPPSTRQRLSQLQLMALVCVYVRKANYFQQVFKRQEGLHSLHHIPTPNIGFSKALSGFLMMMTQNGKLLYISDNAAEYLGHSMVKKDYPQSSFLVGASSLQQEIQDLLRLSRLESQDLQQHPTSGAPCIPVRAPVFRDPVEDLLIHGDSMYDMIDKQDHQGIQSELLRSPAGPADDSRIFLCRMNVSRNARRQMRFGDQKVVLVQGHYLSFLPLCSRNEPVFLATCTPVAMPETRECVVQGATNVFTSIHSMDMKFVHLDRNGEWHLGFPRAELQGASWYQLLHWDFMREAQSKHRLITQSEQDRSCILLVRVQRRSGDWLWVHTVLQVKENLENSQQPLIVATNQVLSEAEAGVMRANSWLYHYYTVQSKLQYGLGGYEQAGAAGRLGYYPPQGPPPAAEHHYPPPQPPPYHQPSPLHHPQPPTPLTQDHFRYGRRSEPEPVDYSVHHEPDSEVASPRSSPASLVDLDSGGGTTVLAVSGGGGLRPRHLVKAALDPTDVMEQWNPSPPWSDTTLQKVPDILHQDLSPYVTTTPPTPGSAVSYQPPPTFTFDWPPQEQFVPAPEHAEPQTLLGCFSWAAPEHRLFPLQPPPRPVLRLEHADSPPAQLLIHPVKGSIELLTEPIQTHRELLSELTCDGTEPSPFHFLTISKSTKKNVDERPAGANA